jgi:hypothetical protein
LPVVFVEPAPVNLVAEEVRSTGKNVDKIKKGSTYYRKSIN